MKDHKPSIAVALSARKAAKRAAPVAAAKAEPELHAADLMPDEERASSIADAILRKRKKMADGGMVDLDSNSEESANVADELNMDALGKEQYDDDQLAAQPMDSNEEGDDIEANRHDMVEAIRRKLRAKV